MAKERPTGAKEGALLVDMAESGRRDPGHSHSLRAAGCVPCCRTPARGEWHWGLLRFPHRRGAGNQRSVDLAAPVPVLYHLKHICFRNKYLLLNNQELNELSAISLKANIPEVEAVLNTDR